MIGFLGPLAGPLAGMVIIIASLIGLALYRRSIAKQQDLHLHVSLAESGTVGHQTEVASRLEQIDKWGKGLTVLAVVYFIALAALAIYLEWQKTSSQILTN